MASNKINVGLIGTKFMGKAHSNAYLKVAKFFDVEPRPIMKAICGRHADETAEFRKQKVAWTDWEKRPPGYRKVVLHWVTSAKRPETRAKRLATLIRSSAAGEKIPGYDIGAKKT